MGDRAFAPISAAYDSFSQAEYLLTLSASQIKAIKKAVAILMRIGQTRDVAVNTVIDAHRTMHGRR